MNACIAAITPETYQPSFLHAADRDWPETNCYTDVWIEILHARGAEPVAGLSFTVSQDFEGDHFTFFKYPPEDLFALYGARVAELAIYDSVEAQVQQQLARGRMCLVEVDSFYLPDTQGAGYRQEHGKTTIGVNTIAPSSRHMTYFHNGGYHALDGEDYDGALLRLADQIAGNIPFPYVEFVKFAPAKDQTIALEAVITVLRKHLTLTPTDNPVRAFQRRLTGQADMVASRSPDFFHKYAFNTFRQLGANFELLASHLQWLDSRGESALEPAIVASRRISGEAKIMQFQLARAVARKKTDALSAKLDPVCQAYEDVIGDLRRLYLPAV